MNIPRTEMRNPDSTHIYKMQTEDMARLVIRANYDAVRAVENASDSIATAIDAVHHAFENGNRLFYVGAGTSGRLGVCDAAECPPTFGVSPDLVSGIIAGGYDCLVKASEGGEDSYENGILDVKEKLRAGDVIVGISAAGGAKYVLGALDFAKEHGCVTVGITSNADSALAKNADISIFTDTGAEIITGSTRLKAGTAQKLVLNILSTAAMVKTGRVYENLMINLRPTNEKLRKRVISIVCEIKQTDEQSAIALLDSNGWNIRRAVECE